MNVTLAQAIVTMEAKLLTVKDKLTPLAETDADACEACDAITDYFNSTRFPVPPPSNVTEWDSRRNAETIPPQP